MLRPLLLTLFVAVAGCTKPAPEPSLPPEDSLASTPAADGPTKDAPVDAPDESNSPAAEDAEASAGPESSSEPAETPPEDPAATVEVWRFTTLVTGGPESLIGANGYYELHRDGEQVTVRKVGQRGTPSFAPEKVSEGTGTLALAADPEWPEAERGSVSVTLQNGGKGRALELELWLLDDELHGSWVEPHKKKTSKPTIGRAWGLLQGELGAGEPLTVKNGERTPCRYCSRAFYNCEGMGEGGCNSSDEGITQCSARMERAQKTKRPVPRGCGDWM